MIHDENDALTDDEYVVARNYLKKSKHACLYIRTEFPRDLGCKCTTSFKGLPVVFQAVL